MDITRPLFVNRSHPLWEFFQLEGEFCKRGGRVSFFFSLATMKIVDEEDRRGNRGDFFFSEILEILRIFFRRDVRRMKRILSSRNVFFFF